MEILVDICEPKHAAGRHVDAEPVLIVDRRCALRRQHEIIALEQPSVANVDDALRLHGERRAPVVMETVGRTEERGVFDRQIREVHINGCTRYASARPHRQAVLERHAHRRIDARLPHRSICDAQCATAAEGPLPGDELEARRLHLAAHGDVRDRAAGREHGLIAVRPRTGRSTCVLPVEGCSVPHGRLHARPSKVDGGIYVKSDANAYNQAANAPQRKADTMPFILCCRFLHLAIFLN